MAKALTLAEKLQLLFEYGESRGISAAYRTIADATGENPANIRKIHRGENHNPGLRTLLALSDYFEIDLAYFNCKTKAECERYLSRIAQDLQLEQIARRSTGLSKRSLDALRAMVDLVREAERLPPLDDDKTE